MLAAKDIHHEKTMAALYSVLAAIGLTSIKFAIGFLTGSLGILAEAAHSGLDLVAALLTFFAVNVADRPADATYHYGHGKFENLSAFLEAGLLLFTGVWIIYEAIRRLFFHEGHVNASIWAFVVMAISILVDFSRSRMLLRVARKLDSQALEADALHFSTDIWSSSIVIVGLLIVHLTTVFSLPSWFQQADAVGALGVSGVVIWVSIRLAGDTIEALLDRAPTSLATQIEMSIAHVRGVSEVRRVRVRRAGNKLFADVVIAASRTLTFEQIHELSQQVEIAAHDGVRSISPHGEVDIVVHVEPTASPAETVSDQIHYLAELQGVHAHDVHVREVDGLLEADFDVELPTDMSLSEAHATATHLEQAVLESNQHLHRVTTHLEAPNEAVVPRLDVTADYPVMIDDIRRIADEVAGTGAHDIHLYCSSRYRPPIDSKDASDLEAQTLDIVLHTVFDAYVPISQVHTRAEDIQRALRDAYPQLGSVIIHTEPPEEQ